MPQRTNLPVSCAFVLGCFAAAFALAPAAAAAADTANAVEAAESGPPASAGSAAAAQPSAPSAAVPSLAKVMQLARERAPAVAVARASVEVSKTSLVGAGLHPVGNPYLEVWSDRGGQNATRDITVQSNLWIPVDVSGQREKREAEARALVSWQSAELDTARALAVAEAVRAYGQLVVADARLKTIEELSLVAGEEASHYERRVQAGDATVADARLAELERAKHVVSLAEGKADRSRALAAVGLATGTSYTDPPSGAVEPPAPRAAAARKKETAELPTVRASAAQAEFHAREKDRQAVEAHAPINFIVTAGRGDLGELRLGGAVAWTFPLLRTNQGEQARAEASRAKATLERDLKKRTAAVTAEALRGERARVREAIDSITTLAEPAAEAAVEAAVETQQAGKGDLLRVLSARRDLALLRARRLELLQREWNLVSDLVALTGELP